MITGQLCFELRQEVANLGMRFHILGFSWTVLPTFLFGPKLSLDSITGQLPFRFKRWKVSE